MPRGDKSAYTDKQKRQAAHIEEGAKKSGKPTATAGRIAWATVNKQDHGGKQSGSGRGTQRSTASSKLGGEQSHSGSAYTTTGAKKSRSAPKPKPTPTATPKRPARATAPATKSAPANKK